MLFFLHTSERGRCPRVYRSKINLIIIILLCVEDGVELSLTSGRMTQTSTGLELRSLTGADSGLYRCTVTNVAGSASSEATLLVHGESETRIIALSIC